MIIAKGEGPHTKQSNKQKGKAIKQAKG